MWLVHKIFCHAITCNPDEMSHQVCIVLYCLVFGPAASAYKGNSWSREKGEYLSSQGLSNARNDLRPARNVITSSFSVVLKMQYVVPYLLRASSIYS